MHTEVLNNTKKTIDVDYAQLFDAQVKNQWKIGNTTANERIKKLDKLHKVLLNKKQAIRDAMYNDFRKPVAEVDLVELFVLTTDIKHIKKELGHWMEDKHVATPMSMMGSNSWIKYEPKGVCLIIAPWNFPLQLALGPMLSAIAAGNTVIIKPSEHTPHTAKLMDEIVSEVFEKNEVCVVHGGVEETTELLKLPFNHIFFTGSPSIGKVVMAAAAKNLTSVTLELGGKSPNIIDKSADLKTAAKRTAFGKFANNGQICLAPDYVLVHQDVKDAFIQEVTSCIQNFYGDDPKASDSYARMVNSHHFNRVKSYVDDAVLNGATIHAGGQMDSSQNYISPTVISDIKVDSMLMTNEIFGPILPIVTFKNIEEVVKVINGKERPLGLYIYSKNQKNIDFVINNTRAGGTCINNSSIHFYNNNLPFGGTNNSGLGKANGYFGFEAFSNQRGILKQNFPGAIDLLGPPYNGWKQKLIDLTIKYF